MILHFASPQRQQGSLLALRAGNGRTDIMSPTRKDGTPQIIECSETDADGWDCCPCLDKTQAERLLDWLEVHGYSQREVSYVEDHGFTVRWRSEK